MDSIRSAAQSHATGRAVVQLVLGMIRGALRRHLRSCGAKQRRRYLASGALGKKPRVVVIGTGWGGNKVARSLDKSAFDVRVISPANHFLFTSFLPSTTVGTLEFRAIQEPIRTVKNLGEYYQAKARALNIEQQTVECEDLFKGIRFEVKYDYLVIAAGCKTNTFNTPGVGEREGKEVFFLKHLHHARQIRNRTLECFERATNPTLTDEERQRLLSFVVVGGGPTSCEFTTELHDFLSQDVGRWYPDLTKDIRVTLVEAGPNILGTFDKALVQYYESGLKKRGITVLTSTAVTRVEEHGENDSDPHHTTSAHLADGTELPFGTMVWSAGLAPVKFTHSANSLPKAQGGRIEIDGYLRVPGLKGRVFALGDCAGSLPPLASVAEQQGRYLADCFNEHYLHFVRRAVELQLPFCRSSHVCMKSISLRIAYAHHSVSASQSSRTHATGPYVG